MNKKQTWIIILAAAVAFAGCGKQEKGKTLQEIKQDSLKSMQTSPHGSMGTSDPHAGLDMTKSAMGMAGMAMEREKTSVDGILAWSAPEAFKEEPASGMRLATFREAANPDAVDVSIVTLSGLAGNIQANLVRWAGQLGLSFGDGELDSFIRSAQTITTQDGLQGWVFDYTALQKEKDPFSTKSIIASIIEMEGSVVFVKMTGMVQDVSRNKDAFEALVRSVHVNR